MQQVSIRSDKGSGILDTLKKDLELSLWDYVENSLWSKIIPYRKLPWYGAEMQVTLSRILKY